MASADLRVSEKHAVSLCGLRRFPITFYADEWETILGLADEIRAFITANGGQLSRKDGHCLGHPAEPAGDGRSFSQAMGWSK